MKARTAIMWLEPLCPDLDERLGARRIRGGVMTRGHWKESAGAWRTTPRPIGWKNIRRQVLQRDGYQCTEIEANGQRCTAPGTDADHIGDATDHSLDNLTTKCGPHHRKKTATQARAVQLARRPTPTPRQHPGLIA